MIFSKTRRVKSFWNRWGVHFKYCRYGACTFLPKNKTREGRTGAYRLTCFGALPLRQHRAAWQGGRLRRGTGQKSPSQAYGCGMYLCSGVGRSVPRLCLQGAEHSCRSGFVQEPHPNRALTNSVQTLVRACRHFVLMPGRVLKCGYVSYLEKHLGLLL